MLRNWWKKIGNWWEVEVKEMMSANVSNLFDEFGGEGESPKREVNLKWFIFPLFSQNSYSVTPETAEMTLFVTFTFLSIYFLIILKPRKMLRLSPLLTVNPF